MLYNQVMKIIESLKNKVIVSCQAMPNEPLYQEECMTAMLKSVLKGNPGGLRVAGTRDVKIAKSLTDIPVIGITKPAEIPQNYKEIVYITPTLADVAALANAGADIIAFDATMRLRPNGEKLKDLIALTKVHKKLSMADISTFEEGLNARMLGADILSTTLSGYTTQSEPAKDEPDFELLEKLVSAAHCPVLLEGRIWTVEQVKKAFEIGAHSVVIGSAITRPQLITKMFTEWDKKD